MTIITGTAAADAASAIIGDAHRVGLRRVSVRTEDGERLTLSLPPTDEDQEAVEVWVDDGGVAALYAAGAGPFCEICGSRPRRLTAAQFTDPATDDFYLVQACGDCLTALARRLRDAEAETGEPYGPYEAGELRLDRSRWVLTQVVWGLRRDG